MRGLVTINSPCLSPLGHGITYLKESLKDYFENTIISPIDILDLFPMFKERYTNGRILNNLSIICGDGVLGQQDISLAIVTGEQLERILEEERQTVFLCDIWKKNSLDLQNLDIYDIITLGCRLEKEQKYLNFDNILIKRILQHPNVDPLFGSILWNNIDFVRFYLDDSRSSKIRSYKLIKDNNNPISYEIKNSLISKLLLVKYIMPSFDIYTYILMLEVF